VDQFSNQFDVSGHFWIADVAFAYRFPGRLGRLAIGVANLFDRQLNYVDPDPASPQFARGRILFSRLTLQF